MVSSREEGGREEGGGEEVREGGGPPHTPGSAAEFSTDWVKYVLNDWFIK